MGPRHRARADSIDATGFWSIGYERCGNDGAHQNGSVAGSVDTSESGTKTRKFTSMSRGITRRPRRTV